LPQRIGSVLNRVIQLVKTEFGLIVLLVIYAFLGATAFYYTEHERDEQLKLAWADEKRLFAEIIWNITLEMHYQDHRHLHRHRHHHQQQHQHHHAVVVDYDTSNSTTAMPLTLPAALADASVNYSGIEAQLELFASRKDVVRPNSKAPGWTFWGALFYCGTIFTTIGWYCMVSLFIRRRVLCCSIRRLACYRRFARMHCSINESFNCRSAN
jgi:hypothetical protein